MDEFANISNAPVNNSIEIETVSPTPQISNSNSNLEQSHQLSSISNTPISEAQYKKALKRLSRLEKQKAFLVDELVKSRQCLIQMKLEREVILDRVADSMTNLFENDFDDEFEEEDLSDASGDEESGVSAIASALARKRELVDELLEKAESDESFSRVLYELSGYQSVSSSLERKRSVILSMSSGNNNNNNSITSNSKKRSKPATSGSRFNRLSAHTQAMRTGIISDDEGNSSSSATAAAKMSTITSNTTNTLSGQRIGINDLMTDSDDFGFDGEEAELAQLKKVRRMSTGTGTGGNFHNDSQLGTPSKDDTVVLKVIQVPYDPQGHPILPLSLNMITVHNLGKIVYDRPAYHNKRYILPVGFTTSRSYLSVLSPEGSINYFSTILDNGTSPLYQVSPEGHPEITFQSTSTTGAWAAVSKAAALVRNKETSPSVSGPDYFGLANPTVSMLIERLPDAEKCESYAFKKYEVSNLVGGKSAKRTLIEETAISNANVHVDIDTNESLKTENNNNDNNDNDNNNNNDNNIQVVSETETKTVA